MAKQRRKGIVLMKKIQRRRRQMAKTMRRQPAVGVDQADPGTNTAEHPAPESYHRIVAMIEEHLSWHEQNAKENAELDKEIKELLDENDADSDEVKEVTKHTAEMGPKPVVHQVPADLIWGPEWDHSMRWSTFA